MGKWIVVALLLALAGCGGSEETGTFDSDAFLAEVSQWEAVKDAAVSDDGTTIYVGVFDNGNNRDGYASSVCEAARAHGSGELRTRYITIMDVVKAAREDELVVLGKKTCDMNA